MYGVNCSAGAWNLCQRSQRELNVLVGYAAPVHGQSHARLFRAKQGWARDPAHANLQAWECEHEEVRKAIEGGVKKSANYDHLQALLLFSSPCGSCACTSRAQRPSLNMHASKNGRSTLSEEEYLILNYTRSLQVGKEAYSRRNDPFCYGVRVCSVCMRACVRVRACVRACLCYTYTLLLSHSCVLHIHTLTL